MMVRVRAMFMGLGEGNVTLTCAASVASDLTPISSRSVVAAEVRVRGRAMFMVMAMVRVQAMGKVRVRVSNLC